tara:strand:- start:1661 stop:1834 length:174 start_codon:yes stop_codon:yes gene_type:complete
VVRSPLLKEPLQLTILLLQVVAVVEKDEVVVAVLEAIEHLGTVKHLVAEHQAKVVLR